MAGLRTAVAVCLGLGVVAASFWVTLKILDSFDERSAGVAARQPAAVPKPAAPPPRAAPTPSFARVEDWRKSEGNATLALQRDPQSGRDVLVISGTGGFVTAPITVQPGGNYVAKISVKGMPPDPAGFSFILLGADQAADGQVDLQRHQHSQIANRNTPSPENWSVFEVEWRVPPSMKVMVVYVSRDGTGPGSLMFRVVEFARR